LAQWALARRAPPAAAILPETAEIALSLRGVTPRSSEQSNNVPRDAQYDPCTDVLCGKPNISLWENRETDDNDVATRSVVTRLSVTTA